MPADRLTHCGLVLDEEAVLWQGRPSWTAIAARAFYAPLVAAYALGVLLFVAVRVLAGVSPLAALVVPLACAAGLAAIVVTLATAVARTTTYVVTTRRVILRYGIALPRSLSIPFRQIGTLSVAMGSRQHGDIALTLKGSRPVPYLKLWPHVRPWRLRRPQPMLCGIEAAGSVATLLARALAEADRARSDADATAVAA